METWIETMVLFQEPNEELEKLGIEQSTEDTPTPFVDRLHRIGQNRKVNIFIYMAKRRLQSSNKNVD